MKKNKHGGARKGAGRKPKAEEQKLIERLDNIINSDEAIEKLKMLINKPDLAAIRLYFEYRFGKPKDSIDVTSSDASIQSFNLSNLTEKELAIILKLHEKQRDNTDLD